MSLSALTVTRHTSIAEIGRDAWDACARGAERLVDVQTGAEIRTPASADERRNESPARYLADPAESESSREVAGRPAESIFQQPPPNPFIAYDFLDCLEASGSVGERTGWTPAHLSLRAPDGRVRGVVPAYLKTHSMGEYVFDHAWARAYEEAGGRYYPKLQVSVPFTPVTGPRLLAADGTPETRAHLARGLAGLAAETRVSSVHATFLDETDAAALAAETWLARTDTQFHWFNRGYRDYDDFLESFASRKRKQVKRERREALVPGLTIERLTGAAITEADWDAFFAFYMDTGSRKWGRPYLNRHFFSLLGERMADRVLLVMARLGGKAVAGALNLIGRDAVYGRNWGALVDIPFLHFEVCYHQAIEFAIERGLARVEAGAQGEHKLARGYVPVTTRSAHLIAHPGLRRAVADYLVHERREVAAIGAALAAHAPYRREDGEAPALPEGFEIDA